MSLPTDFAEEALLILTQCLTMGRSGIDEDRYGCHHDRGTGRNQDSLLGFLEVTEFPLELNAMTTND